jgi:hypothetical protein
MRDLLVGVPTAIGEEAVARFIEAEGFGDGGDSFEESAKET